MSQVSIKWLPMSVLLWVWNHVCINKITYKERSVIHHKDIVFFLLLGKNKGLHCMEWKLHIEKSLSYACFSVYIIHPIPLWKAMPSNCMTLHLSSNCEENELSISCSMCWEINGTWRGKCQFCLDPTEVQDERVMPVAEACKWRVNMEDSPT